MTYYDNTYPVKNFLVTYYTAGDGGRCLCYDEHLIKPKDMDADWLAYIMDAEENADPNLDKSRVFAEMKNGDIYELILRKVDKANEDLSIYNRKD